MVEMFGDRAGWAGAGLLGAVLFWLFTRHLPAKDRQINKLIDDFSRNLELIGDHVVRRDRDRRDDFDRVLSLIAANNQMHVERVAREIGELKMLILDQKADRCP